MRAIFNDVEEFEDQAGRDFLQGKCKDRNVSVNFWHVKNEELPLVSCWLTATYTVDSEPVRLEKFIGEQPTHYFTGGALPINAQPMRDRLEKMLTRIGFQVRRGHVTTGRGEPQFFQERKVGK